VNRLPLLVATGVIAALGCQSRSPSSTAKTTSAASAASGSAVAASKDPPKDEGALPIALRRQTAIALMTAYAARTGLTSERAQRRYLWTDAFAVCNFVGLARVTGEQRYEELALRLVDRVHHVLGRHRADDRRTGWLSGLEGEQAEKHPTRGGLRIGKELPERGPGEPFDSELEWDRDGQYFHYLTQWMHALDVVARARRQAALSDWAVELAERAHRGFTLGPPDARRMVWKMSIDLSRPLVPSMGHHDPLDGYVVYTELAATRRALGGAEPALQSEIADFEGMMRGRDFATDDPLGLGGLLSDAHRAAALARAGAPVPPKLVESLLADALEGLHRYARQGETELPAERRLAFRELGLAIGLSGASAMLRSGGFPAGSRVQRALRDLAGYDRLGETIVRFWLEPEHQRARTWTEHRDINEVMLATSLVPEGFLELPRVP
jgi:hypothetical protein